MSASSPDSDQRPSARTTTRGYTPAGTKNSPLVALVSTTTTRGPKRSSKRPRLTFQATPPERVTRMVPSRRDPEPFRRSTLPPETRAGRAAPLELRDATAAETFAPRAPAVERPLREVVVTVTVLRCVPVMPDRHPDRDRREKARHAGREQVPALPVNPREHRATLTELCGHSLRAWISTPLHHTWCPPGDAVRPPRTTPVCSHRPHLTAPAPPTP